MKSLKEAIHYYICMVSPDPLSISRLQVYLYSRNEKRGEKPYSLREMMTALMEMQRDGKVYFPNPRQVALVEGKNESS